MVKLVCAVCLLAAGPALAEEAAPRALRLIGAAPSAAQGAPARFAIDAAMTEGDGPLQMKVEGWFAQLEPSSETPAVQGPVEGACIEDRCALTADLGDRKLVLSGDLGRPAGSTGRFVLRDYDETTLSEGAATFTPFKDNVPGLGPLTPAEAFTGQDLAEWLIWAGHPTGYSNIDPDPPGEYERKAFAGWQGAAGRPVTGLFTASDIETLKADAAAAKAAVGWVAFNTPQSGWKAGYPEKRLVSLSAASVPSERRYLSPDSKAELVTRLDPPMSGEAWDAFVKAQTDESQGRETHGYMRVNDDFELDYTEKGRAVAAYYFNGEKGLRRMEFSYPEQDKATWASLADILQYAFRAGAAER